MNLKAMLTGMSVVDERPHELRRALEEWTTVAVGVANAAASERPIGRNVLRRRVPLAPPRRTP